MDLFADKLAMVASTVSSKMVEAMAHAEGFKFVECLTGTHLVQLISWYMSHRPY